MYKQRPIIINAKVGQPIPLMQELDSYKDLERFIIKLQEGECGAIVFHENQPWVIVAIGKRLVWKPIRDYPNEKRWLPVRKVDADASLSAPFQLEASHKPEKEKEEQKARTVLMPFGKYRNMPLGQIVDDEPEYFRWLWEEADVTSTHLKASINLIATALEVRKAPW